MLPAQYEAYLKVIGEMSVTFAAIEQSVSQLVCLCIGGNDWTKALHVVDDLQYRKTLDLLEKLSGTLPVGQLRERLDGLIPRLRTAGTDRNNYLHATMMMGVHPEAEYVLDSVRFKYNKGQFAPSRRVRLSTLKRALAESINTRNASERLVMDWLKSIP